MLEVINLSIEEGMAILVVSCDAYSDVVHNYFTLLNKFWPDCKYTIYLINNTKKDDYGNVRIINAGNELDWSGRLKQSLKQIKERYILVMLEDYYIGKAVNSKVIDDALKFIMNNNIKYYRITNIPKGKVQYENYKHLCGIPANQRYGINLQCAIWGKEYLDEFLGDKDCSAWEVETNRLNKIVDKDSELINGCVVDTRNIIDIQNAVLKGKWNPQAINYFNKLGYRFHLGTRSQLSIKEQTSRKIIKIIREILPNRARVRMKKMLSKLGVNFMSEN